MDFVLVALVGAGSVVGEGFRAGEFVVGGGRGDDVAVAGYLAGEAGNGAGDFAGIWVSGRCRCEGEGKWTLVDLAEDDDSGEFGL